ncbi:DUF364 domain-containing protein [Desulfuromonas sp. CSMB_57]|uniref:DUF364 domain-containing protein n=1 Tax=Desulfuromonas sp. CSMB_57 TaxID=2807629 RepID=UPI001CD28764|nr:DUF364 domain-containing protein [Desulfuromonas sp. CSMB_57]
MQLIDALLDSVDGDRQVASRVRIGLHWLAVESRHTGMAHVFPGRPDFELPNAGALQGMEVMELAAGLKSWEPLEAGLGLAALSSLIDAQGERLNVVDYIMDRVPGQTVTCIGRFPFFPDLAQAAKRAFLLEINPQAGELPSFAAEEVVPQSDLLILTATSLINKTMERLLELARAANATAIVLGPSTPMSDVLFDFGASVIAGIRVTDRVRLFRSLSQGVKFYNKIDGIEPVTRFRK